MTPSFSDAGRVTPDFPIGQIKKDVLFCAFWLECRCVRTDNKAVQDSSC